MMTCRSLDLVELARTKAVVLTDDAKCFGMKLEIWKNWVDRFLNMMTSFLFEDNKSSGFGLLYFEGEKFLVKRSGGEEALVKITP